MDHLIGQRFNLISKSEIRYVGTLHEINPEQSTIALEDVYSFGTEDRKSDNFIPPSQQKFDYIVFRGSDVKDIKIVEEQKENKQPSPPTVPNDPAILNASRPGPSKGPPPGPPQGPPRGPSQDPRGQSPFPPPGYPQQPQFGSFPPQHHQYGRGFGPPGGFGHGPQFYPGPPPPPGYFGPPGQGFPQGPGPFPQPPAPIGPPGQRNQGPPEQHPQAGPKQTSELPDNKAPPTKQPSPPVAPAEPAKPVTSVPIAPQVPAVTSSAAPVVAKSQKIAPAIPFAVNQKSFTPPVAADGPLSTASANKPTTPKPMPSQAAMEEASRQAKEAVAAAMAKLNPQAPQQPQPVPGIAAMDALTKKVSEMTTNGTAQPQPPMQQQNRGRGGFRGGRGRSASGGQRGKIDIPKSDYDFESANAKFNKEDLIKEAIATGSPVAEVPDNTTNGEQEGQSESQRKDSLPLPPVQAYNKSTSFFDNISSEAREREEGADSRANARVMRGQEFKKNMETFGQGNVDGGYRGRGRGYRGRNRGFGGRGYNRGYGGRGRGGSEATVPQ